MKRKASWCRSCLYFYLLFFCISSTRADTWPSMNSSFSFFLACIFCSLQMRSTSTALLGSSSVLTLCSFWLCGKICTLSPLEASYDACEANDIALSRASFRNRSFRYKSLQYELKQWKCTKISFTSNIVFAWTRKTFCVNILRSLRQGRESIYTSTE